MTRLPLFQTGQRKCHGNGAALWLCAYAATGLSPIKGLCFQCALPLYYRLNSQSCLCQVWIILHFFNVAFRYPLKPYRLPDTCRSGIITAYGVEEMTLLSLGLLSASHIICCKKRNVIFSFLYKLCNIKRKGNIPALVSACLYSIDPYSCIIVHCAEV